MKGLSKFLGRGLLVLALGSCFVACGDDDDDDAPVDAGGSGGSGGTTAGKGGSGGTTTAGKGGMGGTTPSGTMTCEEVAADMSDTAVDTNPECISCLCDMKDAATKACTGDCWKLAYCVAGSGCGTSDTTCIRAACTTPLGGMEKYMAAAVLAVAVPFSMCAADCFVPVDASTPDAGN
jgi:hypothetical protein